MNKKDFKLQSLGDNWYKTSDSGYSITAKIYEKPSDSGINCGRIVKLFITNADGYVVCDYDRGWDAEPSKVSDLALFHEFTSCFD